MNRYFVFLLFILVGLSNSLQAAETVYVSSKQAKIYKEASFNSELMTSVKQNDEVELLENKGIWMQVLYFNISGWISRYSVTSSKPPKQKISIFARLKNFFTRDNKRERLVLVSTAGGIRGLSERERDSLGKTNFEDVGKMESMKASEQDIDNFISSNSN